MKALLRSSIIVLMLVGGYAGFTTSANASASRVLGHCPLPFPMPQPPMK
jgi:hypothetical protein